MKERTLIEGKLEEGMEKGRVEGLAEGMEKGRTEERLLLARKLKSMGMDVALIVQATGLSEEEVASIAD